MNIHKIKINNFLSIGFAEIMLDNGLILIQGQNKDSPVSDSNGAGKSSIAEAINWCMFYKTKRGLIGDAVVNNKVKKDCYVEMLIDNLRIIRYRKHKKYKNEFHVFSISDDGAENELTKGTNKETDKLFQSLIGMSELTYNKIANFGQGDVASFALLTDAELKQVFEQGFGLVFFNEYLTKIKQYKIELEGKLFTKESEIESNKLKLSSYDGIIEQYKMAIVDYNSQCNEQKSCINKNIKELKKQILEVSSRESIGLEQFEKKMEDYHKLSLEIEEKKVEFEDIENKQKEEIKVLYEEEAMIKSKRKEIQKILNGLKQAQDKVGTNCSECGKEIASEDVEAYVNTSKTSAIEKKEQYNADIEVKDKQQKEVDDLNEKYSNLSKELDILEEKSLGLHKLQIEFEQSKSVQNQVESINKQIQKLESMIAEIGRQESPYVGKIDDTKKLREKLIADIDKAIEHIDNIESEMALTKDLEDIFGNSGMKSYIFDNLTPKLNAVANKYLGMLDDIEINICTQKTLKSGDKREKFEIGIDNHHGANSYKGLSAGEKKKVDLAISLAFNTLVREMSNIDCNVLFLDEVLESLDDSSSERVMDLLAEFAEGIENVFVISHNDSIKDLFSKSLTVTKENGMSSIMFD